MIWEKRQSRSFDYSLWHLWFAWRPVTITGSNTRVWLEWIQRRHQQAKYWDEINSTNGWWEYRLGIGRER